MVWVVRVVTVLWEVWVVRVVRVGRMIRVVRANCLTKFFCPLSDLAAARLVKICCYITN